MLVSISYPVALLASALWFSAAFRYFGYQHVSFAKLIIPKTARSSPIFPTTAALARFLGGMNGAFAAFSWVLLALWSLNSPLFEAPLERAILLMALAAAHLSQFVFNLPIIKHGERQGESYWYVLSGPMLFIFIMDGTQFIINCLAAVIHLAA